MRTVTAFLAWVVATSGAACGGTTVFSEDDGAGGSAATTGTNMTTGSSMSTSSGGQSCDIEPSATSFCVRGEPNDSGEVVRVGGTVTIEVFPDGCFSSACTEVLRASCTLTPEGNGRKVFVESEFCLKDTGGPNVPCTGDCGGGGLATCGIQLPVEGDREFILGDAKVKIQVPSELPLGGACAGVLN